ncbi:MAG: ATP-dependent helicase [Candidatus Heimdallarchaeaceae archaeon]
MNEVLSSLEDKDKIKLNNEQIESISHDKGPLWILAGPGSGKTEVLIWRVFKLILVDNVDPGSIFITTFTEKAAKSMLNRILQYYTKFVNSGYSELKEKEISKLRIGTLHSLCNTILAEYRYKNYQTKKEETSFFFYRYVRMCKGGRFGPSEDFWRYFLKRNAFNIWDRVGNSKSILSRLTEDMIDIDKLENSDNEYLKDLADYYKQYQEALQKNDRCDFASLQKLFLDFLNEEEGKEFICGNEERELLPIKHILVDEYQDTNPIQEEIYLRMIELDPSKEYNLVVVGDDDQAMYRFRGATVDSLINFKKRVESRIGVKVRRVQLKQNYRSDKRIIKWFNDYIYNFPEMKKEGARAPEKEPIVAARKFSQKWNPLKVIVGNNIADVAEKVTDLVEQLVNGNEEHIKPLVKDPSQIAILAHSTRESPRNLQYLVEKLKKRGIKVYNPRNRAIHKSKEIMQIIGAFVEIIDESKHELNETDSFWRISPKVRKFIQNCRKEYHSLINDNSAKDLVEYVRVSQQKIRNADSNERFDSTFHRVFLRLLNCPPFSKYLTDPVLCPRLGILSALMEGYCSIYNFHIQKSSTENNSIKRNRIVDFYRIYCGQLISIGLNDFEDKEYPIVPGYVQVMTYHQAKGLEFPFVILLSVNKKPKVGLSHRLETLFAEYRKKPIHLLSEEQRSIHDLIRLFYVGQSRAKYGLIFAGKDLRNWKYSLGFDKDGNKRYDKTWLIKTGVSYEE